MADVYVSPEEAAKGVDPRWDGVGKIHDWRNHVPEGVRRLWGSFSAEQLAALVDWADELADREEWD